MDYRTYGCVLRNVGEFHLLAIPLEFHVEALESYGIHAHDYHFIEWTCLSEVRVRRDAYRRMLLACTDPVLLMAGLYTADSLRNLRFPA